MRKLTVAEAADQFERYTRQAARAKAKIDEAKPVLLAWFERTGKRVYDDRIEVRSTGGQMMLDQPKVRAFLAKVPGRLEKFMTRAKTGTSLRLLERDPEE